MISAPTMPFEQALDRISGTSARYFDADLATLRYVGDSLFMIGTDTYNFAPMAWNTVAGWLDLPPDLLPQLGKGLGGLVVKLIQNAGRRAGNAPKDVRFSCDEQGSVVAASRGDVAHLANREVIAAVREAWPSSISSETLSVCLQLSGTDFELTCHTSCLVAEPQPGDILRGGITIRHSQVGTTPTVILSYIHRLACSNGMTQRVCLQDKPSRTKRCQANSSSEHTIEAIRQQVKQAWAQLDERLVGMKNLLDHRMEAHGLPDDLRRRWSINRAVAAEVAAAMQQDELGRTYTEYDLINALSRVATHSRRLAPRYRRHLSLAAGMFAQHHVHHCEKCGSWVVDTGEAHSLAQAAHPEVGTLPRQPTVRTPSP